MNDVDVHVPNTPTTRVIVGVSVAIIASTIAGTFALLWTMNEKLTTVATQQTAIVDNFIDVRKDVEAIKTRLRALENRGSD